MKFRRFDKNFHDSSLISFDIGSEPEIALELELDPNWNEGSASTSTLRFQGVRNFDEVVGFLRSLPLSADGARAVDVIDVQYSKTGPNWVILDLAGHGHVEIQATRVVESEW